MSPTTQLPVDFFQSLLLPSLKSLAVVHEDDQSAHLVWLQHQLAEARHELLGLLDFPRPSPEEQRQLTAPDFILKQPRRRPLAVQHAFVQEALNISSNLELSQLLSACYLAASFSDSRFGINHADAAVAIFHHERLAKLQCLAWIFEQASFKSHTMPTALQRDMSDFATDLMRDKTSDSGLIKRLLSAIDAQTAAIHRLLNEHIRADTKAVASSSSAMSRSFDSQVQQQRIDWLVEEREWLGAVLYHVARANLMTEDGLQSIVEWLANQEDPGNKDRTLRHVLLAVMAALRDPLEQSVDQRDLDDRQRARFSNRTDVQKLHRLVTQSWRLHRFRAIILLQWILWLTVARTFFPDLLDADRHFLDSFWSEAIRDLAFATLRKDLLSFMTGPVPVENQLQDREDLNGQLNDFQATSSGKTTRLLVADAPPTVTIAPWFQSQAIETVESLIMSLVYRTRDRIKKLKLTQEDQPNFTAASGNRANRRKTTATDQVLEPRHDLEDFLQLIATAYYGRPNAGLVFWGQDSKHPWVAQKAHIFIKLVSDAKSLSVQSTYLDFLCGISAGDDAALKAFDLLGHEIGEVASGVSWSALYQSLTFVREEASARREVDRSVVVFLKSFLRVLGTVVASSSAVKLLTARSKFQPLSILVEMLSLSLPVDLKATLLNTLTAFLTPGQGSADIGRFVWELIEHHQILSDRRSPASSSGIAADFEEVEKAQQIYPATTALIDMLGALVRETAHLDNAWASTFPQDMIKTTSIRRPPIFGRCMSFVVDSVLLDMAKGLLMFRDDRERWRLHASTFSFLETCLLGLDFRPFMSQADGRASLRPATELLEQPGFDILVQILGQPLLLDLILSMLHTRSGGGSAVIDQLRQDHSVPALHEQTVSLTLQILKRIMHLQSTFLDFILPALSQPGVLRLSTERMALLRGVQPLDLQLSWRRHIAPSIASFIEPIGHTTAQLHLSLTAVQVFHACSMSTYFAALAPNTTRLMDLVCESPDSSRIISGFREWLRRLVDFTDDVPLSNAVLNLLLDNTKLESSAPNIAHVLLGFGKSKEEVEIIDTAHGSSALRSILECVQVGQPKTSETSHTMQSLAETQPVLAQKIYILLRQLCSHDYTAAATLRYLRSTGVFFVTLIDNLPLEPMYSDIGDDVGYVIYNNDNYRKPTKAGDLVAMMLAQAAALDTLALEICSLDDAGNETGLEHLMLAMFSTPDLKESLSDMQWREFEDNVGRDQSRARILELFDAILFEWSDEGKDVRPQSGYVSKLDYDSCRRCDDYGCEIYDFDAVLALLARARQQMSQQGLLSSADQKQMLRDEAAQVIEALNIENKRRTVYFARSQSLAAWHRLATIASIRGLRFIPVLERRIVLLELLMVCLSAVGRAAEFADITEALTATAVILLRQMRSDSLIDVAAPEAQGVTSRLLHTLQIILSATIQPGISRATRGNLYAVMLEYVRYISEGRTAEPAASIEARATAEASVQGDTSALITNSAASLITNHLDKMLHIALQDARLGAEAWQTVTYTLLGALLSFCSLPKFSTKFIKILSRSGHLRVLIEDIGVGGTLLEVCSPHPSAASINAKYVFEAKVSFLTSIALKSDGPENLTEANFWTILSKADWLTSLSHAENAYEVAYTEYGSSALQRRIELEISIMKLCVAVSTVTGPPNPAMREQVRTFIDTQKGTLLEALRRATSLPSQATMEEAHLILRLLCIVLPAVTEEDLALPSGFGGLHRAVQLLAAAALTDGFNLSHMLPDDDTEATNSYPILRSTLDNLVFSLLVYMQIVTGHKRFRSMLMITKHIDTNVSRIPSLFDLLTFIQHSFADLTQQLGHAGELMAQLNEKMKRKGGDGRRNVATTDLGLHLARDDILHRISMSFDQLECALAILLRHLSHIFAAVNDNVQFYDDLSISDVNTHLEALKTDARKILLPMGTQMHLLTMTPVETLHKHFRSRHTLLEILVRNAVDLVCLP